MTGGSSFLATTSPNGSYQSILGAPDVFNMFTPPLYGEKPTTMLTLIWWRHQSWLSLLKMQQATNFKNLHNIWRVIKFAYVCLVLIKFPYVCLMCIHSKQKNSLWGKQIKIYFLKFDLMQLGEWCPNIKSDSISALHFLLRSNNPALREMIRPTERDEALLYSNISIYQISTYMIYQSNNYCWVAMQWFWEIKYQQRIRIFSICSALLHIVEKILLLLSARQPILISWPLEPTSDIRHLTSDIASNICDQPRIVIALETIAYICDRLCRWGHPFSLV